MRIKYLRENFRRDFFQFGGLPTGGRSEQVGGRTGDGAAEAGRGFVGGPFPWAFRERRQSAGDSTGRSTAHKSGQRPPPAPPPGRNRQTVPGGNGGRPLPAPAERARAADGHQGSGTGCRTAATACRIAAPEGFTRTVSGLYPVYQRPPYSPPRALQALPCNPAKPPPQRPPAGRRRSQRHNTADRQPYSTGTASSAASQQAHSHSKHKPPTAKRHSRPPKPQAKPTRRDGERPDDHHRPGPEGCRYSGRVLNLCGCGGAKYF